MASVGLNVEKQWTPENMEERSAKLTRSLQMTRTARREEENT